MMGSSVPRGSRCIISFSAGLKPCVRTHENSVLKYYKKQKYVHTHAYACAKKITDMWNTARIWWSARRVVTEHARAHTHTHKHTICLRTNTCIPTSTRKSNASNLYQSGCRQAVSDQVDPQQLHGHERLGHAQRSGEENTNNLCLYECKKRKVRKKTNCVQTK